MSPATGPMHGAPGVSALGQGAARQATERALRLAHAAEGIFWALDQEGALAAADAIDARRAAGDAPGPLSGMPVAVKDSFAVAGLPRRLGLSEAPVSESDAAAVARLREAGAIPIGTTAMDQLAWGMSGRAPGMPRYRNPAMPGRSTGGSSGGAAAAVAAGIVEVALGGDTAGSVRLPATWCGQVGFKPTFGAIAIDGCAPLARRFDTVGIIARSVTGAAAAFSALAINERAPTAGLAHETPSSAGERAPSAALGSGIAPPRSDLGEPLQSAGGLRVGVPVAMLAQSRCEEAVEAAWRETLARVHAQIGSVRELEATFPTRGMGKILAAELAARWADAVRRQQPERLESSVQEGVQRGESIAATDYVRAEDAVSRAARHAVEVFSEVDLLALPVAPIAPAPEDRPASVAIASAFTRCWSAYGWPAIALPIRTAPGIGLQLVAAPGEDLRLLAFAARIERALDGSARG